MKTIHLGYEVGTGKPVSIPVRNMVVTGQTQEAGKTTTLEALTLRAGEQYSMASVAFVTKRGEGAFVNVGGDHPPNFLPPLMRERADWQFVASLLEATMRERMKFERSWIIQAAKGAQNLAQVQANVKRLLQKAKGLSESVYTVLDAYLEIVVPRLANVHWANDLTLLDGLNVIELSDREQFPPELQMLVIRSVLEWIYENGQNTITILPEAWEFLPQERGSPVKLAATELIRKGSVLNNYVWLDSQDIGGVDKTILRSCPVWLLGVQREANEIKRVLTNIPAGTAKPHAGVIAQLEPGQFFACYKREVIKTYVQPAWMAAGDAQLIARKPERAHEIVARHQRQQARAQRAAEQEQAKMPRNETPADPPPSLVKSVEQTHAKIDRLAETLERFVTQGVRAQQEISAAIDPKIIERTPAPPPAPALKGNGAAAADVMALYEYIRDRLRNEAPAIIAVLAEVPEIQITEQKVIIETDLSAAQGMIAMLIADGMLDNGASGTAVWKELKRRWNYGGNVARAYEQLDKLTALGFLTKEVDGKNRLYQTVGGMKKRIRRIEA